MRASPSELRVNFVAEELQSVATLSSGPSLACYRPRTIQQTMSWFEQTPSIVRDAIPSDTLVTVPHQEEVAWPHCCKPKRSPLAPLDGGVEHQMFRVPEGPSDSYVAHGSDRRRRKKQRNIAMMDAENNSNDESIATVDLMRGFSIETEQQGRLESEFRVVASYDIHQESLTNDDDSSGASHVASPRQLQTQQFSFSPQSGTGLTHSLLPNSLRPLQYLQSSPVVGDFSTRSICESTDTIHTQHKEAIDQDSRSFHSALVHEDGGFMNTFDSGYTQSSVESMIQIHPDVDSLMTDPILSCQNRIIDAAISDHPSNDTEYDIAPSSTTRMLCLPSEALLKCSKAKEPTGMQSEQVTMLQERLVSLGGAISQAMFNGSLFLLDKTTEKVRDVSNMIVDKHLESHSFSRSQSSALKYSSDNSPRRLSTPKASPTIHRHAVYSIMEESGAKRDHGRDHLRRDRMCDPRRVLEERKHRQNQLCTSNV